MTFVAVQHNISPHAKREATQAVATQYETAQAAEMHRAKSWSGETNTGQTDEQNANSVFSNEVL